MIQAQYTEKRGNDLALSEIFRREKTGTLKQNYIFFFSFSLLK